MPPSGRLTGPPHEKTTADVTATNNMAGRVAYKYFAMVFSKIYRYPR